MKSDRVNELYHGKTFEKSTQDACRDRIHWMCAQVVGDDVLDFGCSQGIAALRLAREGYKVVGVDIDPTVLEYARNELATLGRQAREHVRFLLVTPGRLDFDDASFDSVLLGEVLEHQTRPERVLAEARRLLRPGGKVVITVPFGVLPHPDHVRTFYLSNFLRTLEPFFQTEQVLVMHKYLCYVGACGAAQGRREEDVAAAERLLAVSEEVFEQTELAYVQRREKLRRAYDKLDQQLNKVRADSGQQIERMEHRLAQCGDASATALRRVLECAEEGRAGLGLMAIARRVERLLAGANSESLAPQALELLTLGLRDVVRAADKLIESEQSKQKAETSRQIAALKAKHAEQTAKHAEQTAKQREKAEWARKELRELEKTDRKLEKSAEQLKIRAAHYYEQLQFANATVELTHREVRYRLGDSLVRACAHPGDLLRLPGRFAKLLVEGLARRRERRRLGDEDEFAPPPRSAKPKEAADGNGRAGTATTFTPVERIEHPPKLSVRAAVIMDEFTHECFRGECQLTKFTPKNWEEALSNARPDFLFCESVWRGNDGAWRFQVSRADQTADNPLEKVVQWCRERNIPTVFWNKEDPPHFERYLPAAAMFEHVFTTDANCIPHYRERLGHDRISALPFAAQPDIHNPIDSKRPRLGKVCFAGTYYRNKYPERAQDFDVLLKPALRRGLHIYDRQHHISDGDRYRFPDEYRDALRAGLPYKEMVDAYKKYQVFLNVNSVKDSPTMFSRRVLELLACGTPVISTYSLGVERMLGREAVALVETHQEVEQWLDLLLGNEEAAERMVHRGQRRIFAEHTYEHRLRTILETIGLRAEYPRRRVSVIACTNRPDHLERILKNYQRQAYADKELILILNNDAFVLDDVRRRLESVPDARAFQVPEAKVLGECLNHGVEQSDAQYVAKMDDDDFYGEHYLGDLMAAFQYSGADIVGKRSYFGYLDGRRSLIVRFPQGEHRFVTFVSGATMVFRKDVFSQVQFATEIPRGVDTRFQRDCLEQGLKIYSADRFNFVAHRAGSQEEHTWTISGEEFMRNCRLVAHTDDYAQYVTV